LISFHQYLKKSMMQLKMGGTNLSKSLPL